MDGLHTITTFTYPQVEEMAALEAQCYSDEFITPVAESWEWYQRFPTSSVAAVDDATGKIVGFTDLFPVEKPVFDALRAGHFNDAELTADQILPLPAGGQPLLSTMFLSCIVLAPAWRGRGLARRLLREAARAYEGCVAPDARIVTDNVTPEGERLSQRVGFELRCRSDHGSCVYERDYAGFVRALGV